MGLFRFIQKYLFRSSYNQYLERKVDYANQPVYHADKGYNMFDEGLNNHAQVRERGLTNKLGEIK